MDLFRKEDQERIVDYISDTGKNLVSVSRNEVIDKVGQDVMQRIVASILSGGNVRSLTEGLTRRRLSISNASLLMAYVQAMKNIDRFSEEPFQSIKNEYLSDSLSNEEKIFLNWMLGLSGKGIQNILRDENENVAEYLNTLEKELDFSASKIREEFGEIKTVLDVKEEIYSLNLDNLLHVLMAIGAQTLTIRGSEKSVYGKLFERLVLGSVLSILDFNFIDKDETDQSTGVFWLSENRGEREADATLLIEPGVGIRFDIGFIGRGNTEISLDKVSRFARKMERGDKEHHMRTIVIVDTIGDGSNITELAKRIDGSIIQMSMSNWVYELANILKSHFDYDSDFINVDEETCLMLIEERVKRLDLKQFIE